MPIPKYVSAEKYSRDSGIGVEEVKKMCRNGELKCHMTDGRILQNSSRPR